VSEKIADYFHRTLLPKADFVLDIHSGGKTLEFVPFAAAHVLEDKEHQARCVDAMEAFNAPYSVMLLEIDNVGMYDTAAEAMGKVFISTELGGGGSASAYTTEVAAKGVRNFLIHAGILDGEPVVEPTLPLTMPSPDCFVFSEHEGLLESCANLGEEVAEGDLLARVWPVGRTGEPAAEYFSPLPGVLAGRHFPGLIKPGDFLAMLAAAG
jgi:N-alpha-acetyl-L-2,4-diaminobutyrate deacetylase